MSSSSPARILLTGFEPFAGDSLNSSWEVAQALDGEIIAAHPAITGGAAEAQILSLQLPCVFATALPQLYQAIDALQPTLILCLGQAAGRAEVSLERVAINIDDARMPDQAGQQPIDEPVHSSGPAAYFSTLPIKAMVAQLREGGWPAAVSNTAGTFVCNHVFYGLMHRLARRAAPGVRGGFVHLPLLPHQAARYLTTQASMALPTQIAAIRQALTTAVNVAQDLRESGGQLH